MTRILFENYSADELAEKLAKIIAENVYQLLQPQKNQEKYLTRKECADLLQISLVTLNKYTKQGLIPSFLVGGSTIRYKLSEIEGIIEKGLRFANKNRRADYEG